MRGALWIGLFVAACTGETDPKAANAEEACLLEDGTWNMSLTLDAGADPLCPEIEDSSFEQDTDEDSSSTSSCDEGCTCSTHIDDAGCSMTYDLACEDSEGESGMSCTMLLEDDNTLGGDCTFYMDIPDLDTSISCDYTLEGSRA